MTLGDKVLLLLLLLLVCQLTCCLPGPDLTFLYLQHNKELVKNRDALKLELYKSK